MIESLHIVNYALIDDLTIEFKPGLNIFTGSTGAGKTIIFGALGLVLGEKASGEVIRTGASSTLVEAEFSVPEDHELPLEDFAPFAAKQEGDRRLIIRRELRRDGRTKAFVDDRHVTLQSLKGLGSSLTDITGQHTQRGLIDPAGHRQILDKYAGLEGDVAELGSLYKSYKKLGAELSEVRREQKNIQAEKELLEFQIKEIEAAGLVIDEDEQLEQEKLQLVNAELIKTICQGCQANLYDEDGSVAERLKSIAKELGRLSKLSQAAENIKTKTDELTISLDEIGELIRDLAETAEFDPARLEIIEDRLALLKKLKRKYGATIEEILQYCRQAKNEAAAFMNLDEQSKQLTGRLKLCRENLTKRARLVSERRRAAAHKLEKEVIAHLGDLAMSGSDFKVSFEVRESADGPFLIDSRSLEGNESGYDIIEFLICANPGETLKPLASTASGGELSRIMLAICSALSGVIPRDTLVFDEIDSGISGQVASQVGRKLLRLAKNRQVICITHLQQIASQGEVHFKVYKGKNKSRSVTRVKLLQGDQRVAEIARLLAGEKITEIALDGAARLLKEGQA